MIRVAVPVALLGLAVVAGCGSAGTSAGDATAGGHREVSYGGYGNARRTRAAREAGVAATAAFLHTVGTATTAFVADLGLLQGTAAAGDVAGAQADELAAQGQYDAIRFLVGPGPSTASALDGLAADVAPGQQFAGLHLVERDLWDGGNAAGAVSTLMALTPAVEESLSRDELSPQAIVTTAVEELGWVNEVAIPGREEVYSHFDAVDVVATVAAAHAAFEDVAPLGKVVAPGRTATLSHLFAILAPKVAALGVPGTVTDGAIPATRWTAVAQDDDAVAAALGGLAPTFAGYGPRQLYGYNA